MEELENESVVTDNENANESLQSSTELSDMDPLFEPSEQSKNKDVDAVDYARVAAEDLVTLKAEFSELLELRDICELNNPLRYAALRDLGLSPAEAYLATAKRAQKRDNRAHLSAVGSISYAPQGTMTEAEMSAARELFSDISDAQIRKLYKKVTK